MSEYIVKYFSIWGEVLSSRASHKEKAIKVKAFQRITLLICLFIFVAIIFFPYLFNHILEVLSLKIKRERQL
jgi:hypothetical protein